MKRIVSVGDLVMISRKAVKLHGKRIAGKAMDDRAGVAVLLSCLQELSRLNIADYAVATVQEEVGIRALQLLLRHSADIGIAVDVTHGEMPGLTSTVPVVWAKVRQCRWSQYSSRVGRN